MIQVCTPWIRQVCAPWIREVCAPWIIQVCALWLTQVCAPWNIEVCAQLCAPMNKTSVCTMNNTSVCTVNKTSVSAAGNYGLWNQKQKGQLILVLPNVVSHKLRHVPHKLCHVPQEHPDRRDQFLPNEFSLKGFFGRGAESWARLSSGRSGPGGPAQHGTYPNPKIGQRFGQIGGLGLTQKQAGVFVLFPLTQ